MSLHLLKPGSLSRRTTTRVAAVALAVALAVLGGSAFAEPQSAGSTDIGPVAVEVNAADGSVSADLVDAVLAGSTTTTPSTNEIARLRADLAAARALPPAQRLAELVHIRTDMRTGGYGPAVRLVAQAIALKADQVPVELRADLAALRDIEPAERPAAVAEIRSRALAGDYGLEVQKLVSRLADHAATGADPTSLAG